MEQNIKLLFYFAICLRLLMIIWGEFQDRNFEVKYTDVDYFVFSDAARLMMNGYSPFDRSTYRYSPVLAFLLLPNAAIHPFFGKILFSVAEIVVSYQIYTILTIRGVQIKSIFTCIAISLFNPFTFTVSTRGNCESLVSFCLLRIVYSLMRGKLLEASILYGFIVHFRIYPIIFSLSILLFLNNDFHPLYSQIQKHHLKQNFNQKEFKNSKFKFKNDGSKRVKSNESSEKSNSFDFFVSVFNRDRMTFAFVSAFTFSVFTLTSYLLYGKKYLYESLLYHLVRNDHRHNFSIYFYSIYLKIDDKTPLIERILSFLPQMVVQVVFSIKFAKDLPFCMFVQTMAFVTFNKVITAQYFVWYLTLLPLILPFSKLVYLDPKCSAKLIISGQGKLCLCFWICTLLNWLFWAYLLEFEGMAVFFILWIACLSFFATNILLLALIIRNNRFFPVFVNGEVNRLLYEVNKDN